MRIEPLTSEAKRARLGRSGKTLDVLDSGWALDQACGAELWGEHENEPEQCCCEGQRQHGGAVRISQSEKSKVNGDGRRSKRRK